MKTKVRTSALPGAWTVKLRFATAAIVLALLVIPHIVHAQGIVRGAQEGARGKPGRRPRGRCGWRRGRRRRRRRGGRRQRRVRNSLSRLSLPRLLQPLRSFPLLSVTN